MMFTSSDVCGINVGVKIYHMKPRLGSVTVDGSEIRDVGGLFHSIFGQPCTKISVLTLHHYKPWENLPLPWQKQP